MENTQSMKLADQVKRAMIKGLRLKKQPDDIKNDAVLFGKDGVGLDSMDAVELVIVLERNFGVKIADEEVAKKVFASINTIVSFIQQQNPQYS